VPRLRERREANVPAVREYGRARVADYSLEAADAHAVPAVLTSSKSVATKPIAHQRCATTALLALSSSSVLAAYLDQAAEPAGLTLRPRQRAGSSTGPPWVTESFLERPRQASVASRPVEHRVLGGRRASRCERLAAPAIPPRGPGLPLRSVSAAGRTPTSLR